MIVLCLQIYRIKCTVTVIPSSQPERSTSGNCQVNAVLVRLLRQTNQVQLRAVMISIVEMYAAEIQSGSGFFRYTLHHARCEGHLSFCEEHFRRLEFVSTLRKSVLDVQLSKFAIIQERHYVVLESRDADLGVEYSGHVSL